MARAACACLVVKPQVGAGDTYRMKSATASSGSGSMQGQQAPRSPVASPIYGGRTSTAPAGGVATPFNRRVAIAYDTTASGRCGADEGGWWVGMYDCSRAYGCMRARCCCIVSGLGALGLYCL